jgi:hypothetical protein
MGVVSGTEDPKLFGNEEELKAGAVKWRTFQVHSLGWLPFERKVWPLQRKRAKHLYLKKNSSRGRCQFTIFHPIDAAFDPTQFQRTSFLPPLGAKEADSPLVVRVKVYL